MAHRLPISIGLFHLALFAPISAAPASAADYYAGKTVELLVGAAPGGGYDIYARAVGRHLGRHIPGEPTVVVKNMPGAGSAKAAQYIQGIAPKDGTAIAGVMPGAIMGPLLDDRTAPLFNPTKVRYIGTANSGVRVCVTLKGNKSEFLAVSPNNRIPALVDHDPPGGGAPIPVFESGAMLVYLAEKTGKFLPKEPRKRADVLQWLFWQMGGLGPMSGQNNHFSNYATDKIQYAMDRYRNEVNRLYGVMNRRLADRPFLAGEYSIADMASYPWVVPHERQGQKIADFPHLKKWLDTIAARPAVKRAYEHVAKVNPGQGGIRTAEERAILFGQTAASVDKAAAGAR